MHHFIKVKLKDKNEYFILFVPNLNYLLQNYSIYLNTSLPYCLIEYNSNQYWIGTSNFDKVFTNHSEIKIIKTVYGSELLGLSFEPVFFFWDPYLCKLFNYNNILINNDYQYISSGFECLPSPIILEDTKEIYDYLVMKNILIISSYL